MKLNEKLTEKQRKQVERWIKQKDITDKYIEQEMTQYCNYLHVKYGVIK